MKILIAENDRRSRRNISISFQMCLSGWELIPKASCKDCMNSIKEARPDIVILGELNDMPSLEAIAQIRRHSEVLLMALSYDRGSSFVAEAFNACADGVMTQPDRQLELVARTKAILGRRKGVNLF